MQIVIWKLIIFRLSHGTKNLVFLSRLLIFGFPLFSTEWKKLLEDKNLISWKGTTFANIFPKVCLQKHWWAAWEFTRFIKWTLRKKFPYSELFWSVFSRIRTVYGEIRSISRYSVRMQENTDQNNSKYGHFSRSGSIMWRISSVKKTKSIVYCRFGRIYWRNP